MVLLLVALALLALVPASSAKDHAPKPVAFVSAEDDDQLVAVDLTSSRVVGRIRVPDGPHNVAAAGGRWVLVTSPPAGAVTLVDGFSRKVVKVFRGFGYPHDVEFDAESGRAYVTDESRGQIVVIDPFARRIVSRFRVGPRPHDLAIGDVALVTHSSSNPDVTTAALPLGRARVVRQLGVRGPAHDITSQPDSATFYVTYWGTGSVAAVDWTRGRVLWRRKVGTLVHHVQFDYFAGDRLWATDNMSGRVYLLSARNGRVLRTLSGCPGAHHVALGGLFSGVVVACHDADALAIYDTRSWRRKLVPVGSGPHGVAVIAAVP